MDNLLENFTFSVPIQMRWNDLDPLGHVNNAIFITYFEMGRGRYMVASSPSWDWTKNMFLIGKIGATYHKELKLTAKNPKVWVRTKMIGSKSFVVEYLISSEDKEGGNIVHATGETVQIMFDMFNKKTIAIPDWLRKELNSFEKEGTIEEKI
jgi:acyl-CoA thioester hydrolase